MFRPIMRLKVSACPFTNSLFSVCRSASFATPAHVRKEWAEQQGLTAFQTSEYDAALQAVTERLGVTTGRLPTHCLETLNGPTGSFLSEDIMTCQSLVKHARIFTCRHPAAQQSKYEAQGRPAEAGSALRRDSQEHWHRALLWTLRLWLCARGEARRDSHLPR